MTNKETPIEEAIKALKNDIEDETGEEIEAEVTSAQEETEVKAKKSKKSAEKKEKKESPAIKLSDIVYELGIEGLDTKAARKILRKKVKTTEGKMTWAWETSEEAENIKAVLKESFEEDKAEKASRAEQRAEKKAEKEARKAAQEEADEGTEDEEDEEGEIKPAKSSKRKSSRKH